MKKFRKMLAVVLAVTVALTMGIATSFAGTISVQNVVDDETYTAYKILNYRDNGETGSNRAVSYYLTSAQYTSIGSVLEAAGFHFTATSDGTEYYVDNAEALTTSGVSDVAAYLGSHTSDLGSALGTATAVGADGEANFENLGTGYYFVTSTAGSLCALHEDTDIATVVEKNTIPSVDKKEKTSGDSYVDGPVDANIGDTVHYQIVITDGVGTDKKITMTDTMTSGLDYTAGSLKINGNEVADDADTDNWKVTVNGRVITIEFKAAYVANLGTSGTITVTYDATINEDAVIDSATGNENKVELNYSAQHLVDKVYVETYDIELKKQDGTGSDANALDGAKFKVYTSETGTTALKFSGNATDGYVLDANGEEEISAGDGTGVNIRGLEPGTYWFEETEAPEGYNKLDARESGTVTSGATAALEVVVVNNAGSTLPSTGGIGTTIFYILGALLVVGCGVILIARRRMTAK